MMDESKTVALILAQLEPDDGIAIEVGPDVGGQLELTPEEQLHAVAGELVDAVHCNDVAAVVEALRGAFLLFDSMPHVEGEHVDEQAEEAEPEEEGHEAEPVSHEVFERLGGYSEDNGYAYGGRGAHRMARGGAVQRYATGGRVRRYADGGTVESVEVEPDDEAKTKAVRAMPDEVASRAALRQAERAAMTANAAAKRGSDSSPPPWLRELLPAISAGKAAARASDVTAGVAEGALRRSREAAMQEIEKENRRRVMRGR